MPADVFALSILILQAYVMIFFRSRHVGPAHFLFLIIVPLEYLLLAAQAPPGAFLLH